MIIGGEVRRSWTPFEQSQPIQSRHLDVREDQGRRASLGALVLQPQQSFAAVLRGPDLEALILKEHFEGDANVSVIVHDEDRLSLSCVFRRGRHGL